MAAHRTSLETIGDFLAQHRIAMAGISRNPATVSVKLFEELCRGGYDVVPVNPNATELLGRRCFARMQDIKPSVDAALLMTSPENTETVVNDCTEAGIRRVWMYKASGRGSVSAKAIDFCHGRGIQLVAGECPLMFLPATAGIHRFHGFLRKLIGHYPRHSTC
jgi:uncharacterized protein